MYLDLKKTFDITDHMLLLTKLEHCGIRGVAYDWIKRYLCERKQYVSLNICYSDAMNVMEFITYWPNQLQKCASI